MLIILVDIYMYIGSEIMDDMVSRNLATPTAPPSPELGVALIMV